MARARNFLGLFLVLFFFLWAEAVEGAATVRILPLGDSITEGCCITPGGAYRIQLYSLLTNAGYNVDFVGTLEDANPSPSLPDIDHEGHDGYRIDEIDGGIDSWFGGIDDPDVILLHIGTNDAAQNYNMGTAPNRLENLVAHLASLYPNAKIIVASIIVAADPTIESRIETYNSFIPGIVSNEAALGRQVSYADIHSCCTVSDLSDPVSGLHPNATGYAKMATNWFPAITAIISAAGTTNPPAILRVRGQADLRHVVITFTKPVEDLSATTLANYALSGGLSVVQASLDSSKREVTLTTSQQGTSTAYTLTVSNVQDRCSPSNVIASSSAAGFQSAAVPEAANYQLVYSLRIPNWANYNSGGVPYRVDNHASIGSYSRVGYYVELQPNGGGALQYVWVSMNAFSSDPSKLGVPIIQNGAFFQQLLTNMNVRSSVPGVVTGDGLTSGNIEFWWGNYGKSNAANVPNASSSVYDWGDSASSSDSAGYGSMQIHNWAAGQTIFAFNGWGNGTFDSSAADLGIGNAPGAYTDWTQAFNATNYTSRRLIEVYVQPTRTLSVTSSPQTGISISLSSPDLNGTSSGTTPFTAAYGSGTVAGLSAPLVAGSSTFSHWEQDGVTVATTTNLNVTVGADHTLTAVYAPTRTVTVSSSGASAVPVTVAPADNTGAADGSTPLSRAYLDGTSVSLAVPFTSGSGTFSYWQEDGVLLSSNTNVSVVLGADHTLTAVYVATRTLTVSSAPPSGVAVTISPADDNGATSGSTLLSRTYPDGTVVNLAVPFVTGGYTFTNWQQDGVKVSTSTNVSVTMGADHTLAAVYVPTRVLTFNSTPNSGVSVTVSPTDNSGGSNGQTLFTRSYPDGTVVSATVPLVVGPNTFSHWEQDSVPVGTSLNATVTMGADHTLTAVYVPTQTLTVSSSPGSGILATVSPADNTGAANGNTGFQRSYPQGTIVSVAVPLVVGANTFSKW